MTERPHAMLTQDQRAFLRGEKEYDGDTAPQQRWQMRERIQQRIRASLLDFRLLGDGLDSTDREKIFEPRLDESPRWELPDGTEVVSRSGMDPLVSWGISDGIGFFYDLTEEAGTSFELAIEAGVWEAYPRHHDDRLLNDVTIEIDDAPRDVLVKDAVAHLEQGKVPPSPSVAAMMASDDVSDEQILQLRGLMREKSHQHWTSRDKSPLQEKTSSESTDGDDDSGE